MRCTCKKGRRRQDTGEYKRERQGDVNKKGRLDGGLGGGRGEGEGKRERRKSGKDELARVWRI